MTILVEARRTRHDRVTWGDPAATSSWGRRASGLLGRGLLGLRLRRAFGFAGALSVAVFAAVFAAALVFGASMPMKSHARVRLSVTNSAMLSGSCSTSFSARGSV
ncbi:MAG: hypothetical protein GWN07_40140 [Actinobacteria bacterium]|nr:hypothetical protein [Actinomycetota bacterium]